MNTVGAGGGGLAGAEGCGCGSVDIRHSCRHTGRTRGLSGILPPLTLTATSAPITTATRCTVPEPDGNSIAEFSRKPRRSQLPSTSLLVSPQSEKRRGRQGGRQGGRGPAAAGALGAGSPNAPRGWPAPLPGRGAHCLRTRAADVPCTMSHRVPVSSRTQHTWVRFGGFPPIYVSSLCVNNLPGGFASCDSYTTESPPTPCRTAQGLV